jgi:hypothetical protein
MSHPFVYPRATATPIPIKDPTTTPSAGGGASNIKVGGIPLPVFIVLIIFGPFFASFIGYIGYVYFVKKPRERKLLEDQAKLEAGRHEHVQTQLREFALVEMHKPVPAHRMI